MLWQEIFVGSDVPDGRGMGQRGDGEIVLLGTEVVVAIIEGGSKEGDEGGSEEVNEESREEEDDGNIVGVVGHEKEAANYNK